LPIDEHGLPEHSIPKHQHFGVGKMSGYSAQPLRLLTRSISDTDIWGPILYGIGKTIWYGIVCESGQWFTPLSGCGDSVTSECHGPFN